MGGCCLSVCVCLCVSPLFFTFHDWITFKRFKREFKFGSYHHPLTTTHLPPPTFYPSKSGARRLFRRRLHFLDFFFLLFAFCETPQGARPWARVLRHLGKTGFRHIPPCMTVGMTFLYNNAVTRPQLNLISICFQSI